MKRQAKGADASATPKGAHAGMVREDSWTNALTGLGVSGKDKRLGASPIHTLRAQKELEDLYAIDDVAARVVDIIPNEMFREGYEFQADSKDAVEALQERMGALDVDSKLNEAMRWARLYGGAIVVLGVEDGKSPSEPLDPAGQGELKFVTVLNRYELKAPTLEALEKNLASPNYGLPMFYELLNAADPKYAKIDASRVIRFDGVKLPAMLRMRNAYWGDSVINRMYNSLRNYNTAHDSGATIMTEIVQKVYKLKGLSELLKSDKGKDLKTRLQAMDLAKSIINAIVMDKDGEDLELKTISLTGIAELISKVENRLVVATGLPHTLVLGESPSGLGASGDSEKMDFYDYISNTQERELRPIHLRIAKLITGAKTFPSKAGALDIRYNPLWQQSEDEIVDSRMKQSQTDKTYVEMGVLDPEEVRKSRFGGVAYSYETMIDDTANQAVPTPGAVPSTVPGAPAANAVTAPEVSLNGAQVTSLVDIIAQVASGQIPRESGIALLQAAFALPAQTAENIMGTVGKGFKPAPNPEAKAGATA